MPKLQIQVDQRLMEFVVDGPTLIGRTDECEVPIADNEVSRRHCRIEPMEDRSWVLIDLGSRNGTLVNNMPVARHVLRSGDIMQIGKARIAFVGLEMCDAEQEEPGAVSSATMQPSAKESDEQPSEVLSREEGAPRRTGDPEIDQMLSELAPNPTDYLGPVAEFAPAAKPAATAANQTKAPNAIVSGPARRQSWDHIFGTSLPEPAKSKRVKKREAKSANVKSPSLDRIKSILAKMDSSQKRPLVLATIALIALLIMGYAVYATLLSGPKVSTSAPVHTSARAHRISDD